MVDFEWDEAKAESNVRKHGITFQEAATVFGDPLAVTFFDPEHSEKEDRFLTFGTTNSGKRVVVSHADRLEAIRIISARLLTPKERRDYEQGES